MKGQGVIFGRASDEWRTPPDLFKALDREFCFGLDAAAVADNALCPRWLTDALVVDWSDIAWGHPIWLNPPYSQCRAFIAKAAEESRKGCTIACLVPARTDTRWFHEHVYDLDASAYRPGVAVRFLKGRLKFGAPSGAAPNCAPFPSMIVIFRPTP